MLIVDRRIRTQPEQHPHIVDPMDPNVLSAQAEIDDLETPKSNEGIHCIVETPGPEALLQLLTRRVWGIDI